MSFEEFINSVNVGNLTDKMLLKLQMCAYVDAPLSSKHYFRLREWAHTHIPNMEVPEGFWEYAIEYLAMYDIFFKGYDYTEMLERGF